jgi:phosphopantothenoylcysteine decarboxylase / phosphopantothenate---cysteine ligase
MLDGRRVVLGVSGGVAAFKAAYLARRLVEAGATVRAVMTASARHFLGEQTLAAITGTPPHVEFFGSYSVSPHTELARWAECIVIAPATAATMARLANGQSDDLLSATVLAFTARSWSPPPCTPRCGSTRRPGAMPPRFGRMVSPS